MQKNISTNIHIPEDLWRAIKVRAAEEGKTMRELILTGIRIVLGKGELAASRGEIELALRDKQIAAFCRRWQITELSLFGSALRDDFHPQSDIDILVTFAPEAAWTLWDHRAMEEELSRLLERKVDLVSRRAVERSRNWIRRQAILQNAVTYYVA